MPHLPQCSYGLDFSTRHCLKLRCEPALTSIQFASRWRVVIRLRI